MPEKLETSNSRESAGEGTARLLTEPERELLEKGKDDIEILDDRPQILYCAGAGCFPPINKIRNLGGLEAVKQMMETDKTLIYVDKGFREIKLPALPTLNEAIDLIIKREGEAERLLKKFGHLKTDRGVMDIIQNPQKEVWSSLSAEERELAIELSHDNRFFDYCIAFPPERDLGYDRILTHAPPKLSEPYLSCVELEICSVLWLEPHGRSKHDYEKTGFNKDRLLILEDPEILKRAIEAEESFPGNLRSIIDRHFNGDLAAFQKRWKEHYQNWWPDEYRKMQVAEDRIKEWLKTQKEK